VNIPVGKPFRAHVVEVVGGLEHPPAPEKPFILPPADGGLEIVELAGGVLLHGVAQPGRRVPFLVRPGDEIGARDFTGRFALRGRFRGRPEAKIGMAEDLPRKRPQKVEDPRLPPLVFADGLVVHKEVDDRLFPSDPVEPVGVFGRRERILGPISVGEAKGHVVREAVVPEQELQFFTAVRSVYQVGAPPAKDFFAPLGEDRPVAHLFHRRREGVAVDQLRMAEGLTLLLEEGTDPLPVAEDLRPELPLREEEGQGMAVGFVQELDASRCA